MDIDPQQVDSIIAEQNRGPSAVEAQAERQKQLRDAADEAEFTRLANLSPVGFDREKKAATKKMGISVATLKEEVLKRRQVANSAKAVPQWAPPSQVHIEPVNGAQLIAELVGAIRQFVVIDEADAIIVALWILFTWEFGCGAETNPFLRVISATPGCGKSTLFKVLRRLARSGWLVARLSQSAFTRRMDECKRTLLLDEGDAYLNSNEAMRNVLDGASDPDTANVSLSVKTGDNWKPVELNVFVPIAIASIGPLRRMETVEDRSIAVHLKRATSAELKPLSKGRRRELKAVLEPLTAKCARWIADNPPNTEARPSIPDMAGREMDKWESLISIADRVGGEWPARTRAIAVAKSSTRGDDDKTTGVILLSDIRAIFEATNQDRLSSADLCAALAEIEEHPWPEYGRARRPITTRQLARLLKPFGIAPRNIRLDTILKGYHLADFAEVWSRYPTLTSSQNSSATPLQPNGEKECSAVAASSHVNARKEIF